MLIRAMVAAKLANMVVGGKETNSANLQDCTQVSRANAASMLNVSERSVNTAKAVQASAPPEVVQAVEQGSISVSLAAKVAELPARACAYWDQNNPQICGMVELPARVRVLVALFGNQTG